MSGIEIISIATGVLGVLLTGWGLLFGYLERKKRIAVEERLKSTLWITIDRARYVIGDHILLKEFYDELTHPDKYRLWNVHQAASDLYISLVDQYLTQVDRFTYEDLKILCENGLIYWHWQEKQWRNIICRRPENVGSKVPEYFTRNYTRPWIFNTVIEPDLQIASAESQKVESASYQPVTKK